MLTINRLFVPIPLATLAATTVAAQQRAPRMDCDDGWRGWRNAEHFCEVREMTIKAADALTVDAGRSGGISVTGSERKDVLVRAMVHAWGDDEAAARELASQIVVHTDGAIRAEGPDRRGDIGWSVSYEVFSPRDTDVRLETHNGGIAISNLNGNLNFDTTNGGIHLDDVAGNVRGQATNGGVDVRLTGTQWDGEGLDVRTINGGVTLRLPEDYSARLETRTVNGGLNIDFPVTVQGRIGREISTTLGKGGPLVRAETTNGSVRVVR